VFRKRPQQSVFALLVVEQEEHMRDRRLLRSDLGASKILLRDPAREAALIAAPQFGEVRVEPVRACFRA
jgi:hypothetical protein